ncbi:DNA polymerase eta [Marchantia polymorpha subsp. ruderalis]
MPVARPEPPDTRVIAHVDLDCFYVQVEQRRHPELKGKPTAVVQYKPFRGGAIIAVGYEARHAGVTRIMRGDDARKLCPDINLVQVPVAHGKADLTIYRDAGTEVVEIFSRMGICERASIDEVYLDITEAAVVRLMHSPPYAADHYSAEVLGTHIIGLDKDSHSNNVKEWLSRSFASRSDQLLACGALIISELRTAVVKETQFTTSAGIAHNKMLAKLASGMHKPAQQTLVPSSAVQGLLATLPTRKIKYLGGKLGRSLESDHGIKTMGDLLPYTESKLQSMYGVNTGTWLWRVARGMNGEEVEGRTLPKSHGCSKTFPGPESLKNLDTVGHWLSELSAELQERLDEDLQLHHRKARLLVVHAACHIVGRASNTNSKPFPSKSCAIRYGKERVASDAVQLFKRSLSEFCPDVPKLSPVKGESGGSSCVWAVTGLSVSASNMYEVPAGMGTITRFFGSPATSSSKEKATGTTSTLPSSPVSDVSDQAAGTRHERVGAEFPEEVISLNEPDDKILSFLDASMFPCNSLGSLENDEEAHVPSPFETDAEPKSHNNESEAPASPNAYAVLSGREGSAWTQEREVSRSHLQSSLCPPSTHAGSHSRSCKPVKRNLMDHIDPSACNDKDWVCTPTFGEVSKCAQPPPTIELSDISSDCYPKDAMADGSTGTNSALEAKSDLADGISVSRNNVQVILCSPLDFRLQENLSVGSDVETERGPQLNLPMTDIQQSSSSTSNIVGGSLHMPSTEDLKLVHPVLTDQVEPTELLSEPVEESRTCQATLEGPWPLFALKQNSEQPLPPRSASSIVTLPHQTNPEHSTSSAVQIVLPDQANLSPTLGLEANANSPAANVNSVSPNFQSSNRGELHSGANRQGLGSRRRTGFSRVDELWEKWKVASQSSATTPETEAGCPSVGGTREQNETGQRGEGMRRDFQVDGRRSRKRKKSTISDFFVKSPSK